LKKGVDDKFEKYKTILVEKWYSQIKSIYFHKMFSSFINIISIHVVLALIILLDLELEKLDVKTTINLS
jgi:hypothetical protein